MTYNLSFLTTLLLTLYAIICVESHEGETPITFSKIPETLKIGLSDMTATYAPDLKGDGVEAIILTGGCSAETGNQGVVENGKTNYYCGDITANTYIFYPSSKNIVEVAPMPIARYRHSATFIDGKLYVIGGRTFDFVIGDYDKLVQDIIVYDPKDGTDGSWSTFLNLPLDYAASDHTSFARQNELYILGGYSNANYDAREVFYKINLENKNVLTYLTPMKTKRGDAQGVYYNNGGIEAAYIMGGFTHENGFCEPLNDAERYNFNTNTWTTINPLLKERGDKGVVVLGKRIIAIGGEKKHEMICKDETAVEPSSHAIVVDDVESYEPGDGDNAVWHQEPDFSETRFRSAVAASEKLGEIYVFGGQMAHDVDCDCFKTSKDIFVFRDDGDGSGAYGLSIGYAFGVVAVSFMTLLW